MITVSNFDRKIVTLERVTAIDIPDGSTISQLCDVLVAAEDHRYRLVTPTVLVFRKET